MAVAPSGATAARVSCCWTARADCSARCSSCWTNRAMVRLTATNGTARGTANSARPIRRAAATSAAGTSMCVSPIPNPTAIAPARPSRST